MLYLFPNFIELKVKCLIWCVHVMIMKSKLMMYIIYLYIIIYEFIPARPKKIPSRVAPSECSGSRGCNACLAIAFSGGLLHTIYLLYIYNYLPIISGWNDQLAGSSSIGSGVKLIVCLRRGVDGPPTFWAIEISSSEGPRSSCCGPHSF